MSYQKKSDLTDGKKQSKQISFPVYYWSSSVLMGVLWYTG